MIPKTHRDLFALARQHGHQGTLSLGVHRIEAVVMDEAALVAFAAALGVATRPERRQQRGERPRADQLVFEGEGA